MIQIDGKKYNVNWIADSLEQTAEILSGEGSGRLQGTHEMYIEYVGTFINHKGEIVRSSNCTDDEWNDFYRILINPKNKHTVTFPFDDGEIEKEVYISTISRKLRLIKETNKWSRVLSVSLVSIAPDWVPDEELKGYTPYDNG
jgi:hypothetical protein